MNVRLVSRTPLAGPRPAQGVVRATVRTAVGVWAVVAAFMVVRKWQGALALALPESSLAILGLLMVASLIRWAELMTCPARSTDTLRVGLAPLTLAVLATTVAAAPPMFTAGAGLLYLSVGLVELGWWTAALLRTRNRSARRRHPDQRGGVMPQPAAASRAALAGATVAEAGRRDPERGAIADWATEPVRSESDGPLEIIQHVTRWRQDNQGELLRAVLRADLEPNERSGSLHIAFCPPLPGIPELELEQLEGPAAVCKVAEVQTYGARIDIRLLAPSTGPLSVWVAVNGVAGAAPNAATSNSHSLPRTPHSDAQHGLD